MSLQPGPSLSNVSGTENITILNATVPPEGPKCVPIPVDLTSVPSAIVDFTLATGQAKIAGVQSIYLDNSTNTEPVTIKVDGTQQTIEAPAGSQGTYPVISTNRPKFTISSGGAIALIVHFLNVPVPCNVWFPRQGELTQATGNATSIITTGGVAVNVWNPPPSGGGVIINPKAATESLFIDIVNAAGTTAPGAHGTTVELAAGESFVVAPNFGGVVSANAATSGHAFTAYGLSL